MEKKIVKEYIYSGFGFPVHLKNVTMLKIGGTWAPRINHEKIAKTVIKQLSKKDSFTGNEVFFIRAFFKLTKVDFGKKLKVSHVAVSKWEKKREEVVSFHKGNKEAIDILLKGENKKRGSIKKPNSTFIKLPPNTALAKILGSKPIPRTEVIKRVWAYIKKHDQSKMIEKKAFTTKKKATRKTIIIRHRKNI